MMPLMRASAYSENTIMSRRCDSAKSSAIKKRLKNSVVHCYVRRHRIFQVRKLECAVAEQNRGAIGSHQIRTASPFKSTATTERVRFATARRCSGLKVPLALPSKTETSLDVECYVMSRRRSPSTSTSITLFLLGPAPNN